MAPVGPCKRLHSCNGVQRSARKLPSVASGLLLTVRVVFGKALTALALAPLALLGVWLQVEGHLRRRREAKRLGHRQEVEPMDIIHVLKGVRVIRMEVRAVRIARRLV